MFRFRREGSRWSAANGQRTATGDTPLQALRSLKERDADVMDRPRRWVLYAASGDELLQQFADTVVGAGSQWKPVAIDPIRVDEIIKAVQPEAVVVATKKQQDESLLRRMFALHGHQRIVVDDRQFKAISQLLRWSRAGHA